MSESYEAAMEIQGALQGLSEKMDDNTATIDTAADALIAQLMRIATALEAYNARIELDRQEGRSL